MPEPISRRRFASAVGGAFVAVVGAPTLAKAWATTPEATANTAALASQQYGWQSVRIGGGGFVDGIVFNQSQAGLVYARTDIGGAYRWDQTGGHWVPMLDWVGFDNWGYNGVVSLASDPVDPNRVYVAVGMYTNSWDPNNGAVLRSSDQGATWAVSPLPFKLGGNMPGRGMGERLAVDPNNNNVLYLGTPSGNGLWRSTDAGVTWSKVASFPNAGTYVADPTDTTGYQSDKQGIVWVTFDKSTSTAGQTTKGIYVGVADLNNTVYRSTDGGSTWQAIVGAPTGFIAHKGVLDPVNHVLYIATSNTGGPYDGGSGDVWKLDTQSGAWTLISPVPSTDTSNDYFGYSGLAIDRQHPGTIMVATQVSWWPDIIIFRSTDAGATWTRIWDFTSYPDRSLRYTLDITSEPWLTFGTAAAPPVPSPKLGWMTEALEIDPFDSDRLMYGTGATLYAATNLTSWDAGQQITIKPMVAGLEETAVQELISPPSGAHLLSALGDIGGFKHDDLTKVPALMYTQPNLTTTTGLDFAELAPSTIVRAGNIDKSSSPNVNRAGFSTDGGANWFQASSEPGGVSAGGTIAVAADASVTVWAPAGASVSYSTTFGSSWTSSTGIPSGALVRSDRADAKTFYGFSGGRFYVSTNGGAAFTATAATGLPSSGTVAFKAVPGHKGDIWLAGGSDTAYGLWHSTDSGATFTKLADVDQADNIGFGMPATGQTYPALYAIAQIGGVRGVFRSDDAGASWTRINDAQHQYGNIGQAITGDPRVYGRVYLGTNGRGILYADPSGTSTSDTTAPSAPANLAVSGTTSSSVSLTWSASTDNVGVTGYNIYRGTAVAGTSATTSFTDSGLAASTAYSYTVKAFDAAGNVSAASNAASATTQDGGGTGTGALKVQYKNNDTAPGDNQIRPGLQLVNAGTAAVVLSSVTVRYWFTGEAGASTYSTYIDYAALGSSNITTKVVAVSPARAGADHYLEVGFATGAGSLAAGASSGDIQCRLNKTDWSNFDETDDYSYGTNTSYADAPKITAYVGGTLVYGNEP